MFAAGGAPSSAAAALAVTPLPPAGFVWGESFVFDDNRGAATLTKGVVVPTKYDAGDKRLLKEPPPRPASICVDDLIIGRRVFKGSQSEVWEAELPGHAGPVAVKLGIKAAAIAREAEVLSIMSGVHGFPTLLHYEADGPDTPGGSLIFELLGPSLGDVHESENTLAASESLSGAALMRAGGRLLRLLRRLHRAGFVHNDVKPSNILLDAGSEATVDCVEAGGLHLIDFGSCTRIGDAATVVDDDTQEDDADERGGPIGTLTFASVAADECEADFGCEIGIGLTQPADDIESLVYTLVHLASVSGLPWHGKPEAEVAPMKRELLTGDRPVTELTEGVGCEAVEAALQALYAEVRRCRGGEVDYEACLRVLGEVASL